MNEDETELRRGKERGGKTRRRTHEAALSRSKVSRRRKRISRSRQVGKNRVDRSFGTEAER